MHGWVLRTREHLRNGAENGLHTPHTQAPTSMDDTAAPGRTPAGDPPPPALRLPCWKPLLLTQTLPRAHLLAPRACEGEHGHCQPALGLLPAAPAVVPERHPGREQLSPRAICRHRAIQGLLTVKSERGDHSHY